MRCNCAGLVGRAAGGEYRGPTSRTNPEARLGPRHQTVSASMNFRNGGGRWHSYVPTRFTSGGFHVPEPGGKIDGGSAFGQYRRITR